MVFGYVVGVVNVLDVFDYCCSCFSLNSSFFYVYVSVYVFVLVVVSVFVLAVAYVFVLVIANAFVYYSVLVSMCGFACIYFCSSLCLCSYL